MQNSNSSDTKVQHTHLKLLCEEIAKKMNYINEKKAVSSRSGKERNS